MNCADCNQWMIWNGSIYVHADTRKALCGTPSHIHWKDQE